MRAEKLRNQPVISVSQSFLLTRPLRGIGALWWRWSVISALSLCGRAFWADDWGLAALALAEWQDGELAWRGKVGTGCDAATLRRCARFDLDPRNEASAKHKKISRGLTWISAGVWQSWHYEMVLVGSARAQLSEYLGAHGPLHFPDVVPSQRFENSVYGSALSERHRFAQGRRLFRGRPCSFRCTRLPDASTPVD